jgi:RNA polymerase sigma-70 factor (ECF subfamily)
VTGNYEATHVQSNRLSDLPRSGAGSVVVWSKMRRDLVRFVNGRVESRESAEDIVQDVLERFHRTDPENVASPTAWLYRAARNAVVDHYRTRAGTLTLPEDLGSEIGDRQDDGRPDAGPNAATQSLARCLRPFVARLPDHYRSAVTRVDLDGATHVVAARAERVSVSGMKSRVQRGRAHLADLIQECCAVTTDADGAVSSFEPKSSCGC